LEAAGNINGFVGVEATTGKCTKESSTGSLGLGVTYCKAGYCIDKNAGSPTLNSCILLINAAGRRGKTSSNQFCAEQSVSGMSECCAGFCLVASTSNSCESFSLVSTPARISKDKVTHLCLNVNDAGSSGVTECYLGKYCIINPGTASAACVLLDSSISTRIASEKVT